MLFNSFEFILFLPIVFLLYWFVFNKSVKLQNLFIIVVSYIFYGWWDKTFLLLIAFTTFCSYISGICIQDATTIKKARCINLINILLNLGVLGVYKYYDFFALNLVESFAGLGITIHSKVTLDLILPVGISFYTFQALSYSIDVYRKNITATRDILSFFAYVSFFPQLVAGPIERATHLLPQFSVPRVFEYTAAVDGLRRILWGLFKKIVIADSCALQVDNIFRNYEILPGSTLWIGAFFFTLQIYGDFSGYSDIAIGVARLFGIDLMQNFNFPYFSRDIAEFWRRWHISLSTWFRDYLYIPLGGSRGGKWKSLRNTFLIFTVSGLWHGANWTYILWGAYHGLLFTPLLLTRTNRKNTGVVAIGRLLPSGIEFLQMSVTFLLVMIGWVLFRADSVTQAFLYLQKMFSASAFAYPAAALGKEPLLFVFILFFLIMEWLQREKYHVLEVSEVRSSRMRYTLYATVSLFVIFYMFAESATFIYFQF